MQLKALFLVLYFLSRLVLAAEEDWEPQFELEQFEQGQETVNIIYIRPVNIRALVESTPAEERPQLVNQLWHNRAQCSQILHHSVQFILAESLGRAMVPPEKTALLTQHFRRMLEGHTPLIIVTEYNNFTKIHQLIGRGLDYDGLPLERRLVGRGMEKLPRPQPSVRRFPVLFVEQWGNVCCEPEVTGFLSRIEHACGAIGEMRSLTKDRGAPHDYSELLNWRAISKGWYWEGTSPLKADERAPALTGEDLRTAIDLHKRFPSIPEGLLFPERQRYPLLTTLYAHTLTDSRERLYASKFGVRQAFPTFIDPDYGPLESHILELDLETWLNNFMNVFSKSSDHQYFSEGTVESNPLPLLAQTAKIRNCSDRLAHRPHLKQTVVDVRRYTVPKNRYLDQIYRVFWH